MLCYSPKFVFELEHQRLIIIIGISRQGVHDMVKRCTKTLEGYESKLHLIEKFQTARGMVTKIHTLTKEFYKNHDEAVLEEIEQISNQILEEL